VPKIKIEDVAEGMVVESDVRNLNDMVLISKGTRLSRGMVEKMVAWGVAEVDIRASEELRQILDPVELLPADVAERFSGEVRERFPQLEEGDELMNELYRIAVRRKAKKYLRLLGYGSRA